jgi:hypothetical protein
MKRSIVGLLAIVLVAVTGCGHDGSAGGPGAKDKDAKKPLYGEADNTFNLSVPTWSTTLQQGETKEVLIGIKRGKNFDQEVAIRFDRLPTGMTIEPASPVIKQGDTEAKLLFKSAADASVGDFTVKITGHPTKGADASNEMKVTVAKQTAKEIDATAAKAKRDEYVREMHRQLETLDGQYEDLKGRAAKAEGQAKKDLDQQLAEAKVKRDAAATKLDELKKADATRWEKIKDEVGSAFTDLKKMFK